MVSFRNRPFAAVFLGLVMADAVSQGYLADLGPHAWPFATRVPESATNGVTGMSDRACQTLIQHWRAQDSETHNSVLPSAIAPARENTVGALEPLPRLLVKLPSVLVRIDHPAELLDSDEQAYLGLTHTAEVCFYQSLISLLNQDIEAAQAAHHALTQQAADSANAIARPYATAMTAVFRAEGDFLLSLGQGLMDPLAGSGTPLLAALLSASWVGRPGLPMAWQRSLNQPQPALKAWLQQRWQIPGAIALTTWSTALWAQWCGHYEPSLSRRQPVAARPVRRGE